MTDALLLLAKVTNRLASPGAFTLTGPHFPYDLTQRPCLAAI